MDVNTQSLPAPNQGFVLTHFITSRDVKRARDFYIDVLGGNLVRDGEPTIVGLANSWIIINVGGGPTDDKPDVFLDTPPDEHRASSFLNIRVCVRRSVRSEARAAA